MSDPIADALVRLWRETYPPEETMLVSRYVVVAEVIDSDGDETLRIHHDPETPPWTRVGMIHGALGAAEMHLRAGWEGDDE